METNISPDLLTSDSRTIDAKSITFAIWKNKTDPAFIGKFIELLSQFIDEKRVFDDIEFYLPQLAHLVIHLDVDWDNKALERFAVLISEASLHTALQLVFILVAAMEDYQPENSKGTKNYQANPTLFFRCARLLQNIERAVIFGSPELSSEEEEAFNKSVQDSDAFSARFNHITHDKIKTLVNKIVDTGDVKRDLENCDNDDCGSLLYKRVERKGIMYRKPWKPRFITIEQRVLSIYHDEYSPSPLRALPLQGCSIVTREDAKYPFYFEIENKSTGTRYLLRAPNQSQFDKWINRIKKEIDSAPVDNVHTETTEGALSTTSTLISHSNSIERRVSSMSSYQLKRFKFFEQQRSFVTSLTDICESLRFRERDVRKFFLKKDMTELVIPPFVYLPLCSSSDRFRYILRTVPSECHAFNTKARCPALMFFEVEEHKVESVDYMTFLSQDIWEYPEESIIETRKMSGMPDSIHGTAISTEDSPKNITSLPSKLSMNHHGYNAWREEGTGLRRLSQSNGHPEIEGIRVSITNDSVSSPQTNFPLDKKIFLDSDTFNGKAARVKAKSLYKHLPNWKLDGLIAKSNDDVRQEVFVMQMISALKRVFHQENVDVWIHTYRILSTSKSTGLIELIKDSISLDGLKKKEGYPGTLRKYFEVTYGYSISAEEPPQFKEAIMNYLRSMAGYSIVCYLLAIKDRHNGNIMLDADGHIIHIDFGFVFGLAPGKAFSMERAPFKLNEELAEVMGGPMSNYFALYRQLCIDGLKAARKHSNELICMMEIMFFKSNYPAFRYNPHAIQDFTAKLHLDKSEREIDSVVDGLITKSYKHKGTDFYDSFQKLTNGIAI